MDKMEIIDILDMIEDVMERDPATAFSKITALHAGIYIASCENGKMAADEEMTIILQILMECELAFGILYLDGTDSTDYKSRISMVNGNIDEFRKSVMKERGTYAYS